MTTDAENKDANEAYKAKLPGLADRTKTDAKKFFEAFGSITRESGEKVESLFADVVNDFALTTRESKTFRKYYFPMMIATVSSLELAPYTR